MGAANELLKTGDAQGALAALSEEIRSRPGDAKLRVFLCQLLCVLGQWERALNQLTVAAELDALAVPMKQMYGDAIRCEGVREEVFAGKRSPMVFGQPDEWLALLIESLLRAGRGEYAQALQLQEKAFDQAPARSGSLNGQAFEWLADADMRLGPVLEAFINGRYYWVPFARLAHIKMEGPEDLRDMVWMPAHLQFENGGESLALIPTRYHGSHRHESGKISLARETHWQEAFPGMWTGLGQRAWSTQAGEHAMLEVREIQFNDPSASG
jgi:type VI secretion system protein ImpE